MVYNRKDHYYRLAKSEGKASRAVYKLSELQKRFNLVRKGDVVIDFGCAPGGWMQELSALVGPKGRVVGIDILPLKITVPKNCVFIKGDATESSSIDKIKHEIGQKADTLFSDISPNISGIAFADSYRSFELCMCALGLCRMLLKKGGNFVTKIFYGDEFASFVAELKKNFDKVETVIPKATRTTSSERYVIARGFNMH